METNIQKILRDTLIDLLNNENGVNEKGFDGITKLCEYHGWEDILDKAECQDGGFFLWEDDAESLKQAGKIIK